MLSSPVGGGGSMRSSTSTSVTAGSAPTVASFWPLPPTICISTSASWAAEPSTLDSAHVASMSVISRVFLTVPSAWGRVGNGAGS
eukprot:7007641-Prymnesium_polylepis.1